MQMTTFVHSFGHVPSNQRKQCALAMHEFNDVPKRVCQSCRVDLAMPETKHLEHALILYIVPN